MGFRRMSATPLRKGVQGILVLRIRSTVPDVVAALEQQGLKGCFKILYVLRQPLRAFIIPYHTACRKRAHASKSAQI